MKTTLAILITALASTVGAFADQPVFNSKGTLLYMKRDAPAPAKATTNGKANCGSHSAPACKSCCAR